VTVHQDGLVTADALPPPDDRSGRRDESISWLELFFDLGVVAAVAVLAHGLQGEITLRSAGMVLVLYTAIWTGWSLTVLYANVAREQVRPRTMLTALFLIAVMTAAAPLHSDERANTFAIAFLVLRSLLAQGSARTGRVLGSWPLLQLGGLTAPWIVSLWVQAPAKYWLWGGALLADLVLSAFRDDDGEAVRRLRAHRDRDARRHPDPSRQLPEVVPVELDRSHIDERLGLFVIIVLGEAVLGLVQSVAGAEWTRPLLWSAVAFFVLLAGLWRQTFAHGFTSAPHVRLADLPPRAGLPLHLLSTLGLMCVAAGMTDVLAAPSEPVTALVGWVLAGGLALHLAVGLVAGIAGRAARGWLLGRSAACTLFALALGLAAPHLGTIALSVLAAVPAVWAGAAPLTRDPTRPPA
jgi:low temperature requirement protein LtrA